LNLILKHCPETLDLNRNHKMYPYSLALNHIFKPYTSTISVKGIDKN